MKVVVTGATGHLGTYVVSALAEAGHDLVAMSRSGALPAPPFGSSERRSQRVRAQRLDVTSDEATALLARELGPDVAIVHLAAWHPPNTAATGVADRCRLMDVNVHGTMRVLEAARRSVSGASVVVYASTFEVYGDVADTQAITESTRVTPITDYGATKLAGEDHLISFGFEEQTRVIALRFPAIYGPGEKTARALPNFLRAVSRNKQPQIFGDGSDLRDQIHARDAALAIERALMTRASGIFNIADGEQHSILQLARNALAIANLPGEPDMKLRIKPRRDYHMDISKARVELGFSPTVGLMQGMTEEFAWLANSA